MHLPDTPGPEKDPAGHHCAADPGEAAQHGQDLAAAVDRLREALPELPVQSVCVDGTCSVAAVPAPVRARAA